MEYLHTADRRLPFLRAEAKRHGLTFTRVAVNFDGAPAYRLFCRRTGSRKSALNTLAGWYDLQARDDVFAEYAQ